MWPVMSMEVMSCQTQGDARSLFLPGDLCFPSADGKGDSERQGRASKSERAAGDRQGLQVGAMCTEEWTDRPLSVCETEWTDRHTKSPGDRVRTEPSDAVTPQAGFSHTGPSPALCPPPPQPGQAYLCVTESPMSLRTICGDP